MCWLGFGHSGTAKLVSEWADVAVSAVSGELAPVGVEGGDVWGGEWMCRVGGIVRWWWYLAPVWDPIELKLAGSEGDRVVIGLGDVWLREAFVGEDASCQGCR